MEAEYDRMAEEYDATRDAPTEGELAGIASSLEGCKTVLDVGVGTGRFAVPISGLGFEVTGLDVSRRMLLKGKGKGLERLLVGDAYKLPFRDKSFDAAMIIHVLHVVADWVGVMKEIGRVTKGTVTTILRVREGGSIQTPSPPALTAGGYPLRTQHRMWQNERELRERAPPWRVQRIRDEVVEIPVADAFKRLEAKMSVGVQMMPPEIRRAMVERIIATSGSQSVHRRIVEDLAVWKAEQLQALV